MDVVNSELSWLSNHLAHGITTHKSFYRQYHATLELAKVSKLLLVAESGNLGKLKGKKLQDIDLDGKICLCESKIHLM